MSDARTVPLYQGRRATASGAEAAIKPGDSPSGPSATWLVKADTLGGIVPKPGDRLRGTDGVWWVVQTVAPLADGAHPCLCDRETGAAT